MLSCFIFPIIILIWGFFPSNDVFGIENNVQRPWTDPLSVLHSDHRGTTGAKHSSAPNLSHFDANFIKKFGKDNRDEEKSSDTLFVKEFLLARDVIEREPVEIVESYTMSNARAWCFARLHNSAEIQDVFFKWYYEDELYFEMNSKIGISINWRTYSSVGLQPGSWRVLLENEKGKILDEIRFYVNE